MKVEEFKKNELYEKFQQEDNDIGLDYKDLEVFIKDKEEVYLSTGVAEGEHNVELAIEIAVKNLEKMEEKVKLERCLLMIEGDLLMQDVYNGIDILREKLGEDVDVIFGSKYIANNEKKVKVYIREEAISYGLTFPDTYMEMPFKDKNWQLIRVKDSKKAFLWIYDREGYINLNVKVYSEWRDFWRKAFKSVIAGWHQNKEHWNTIILDGSIPEKDIKKMIAESYDIITDSPTKRIYDRGQS